MMHQPHSPLHRWAPALLSLLFLGFSLDLYQRVEQGDLPGQAPVPSGCPRATAGPPDSGAISSCPFLKAHHLTAEVALAGGGILAVDLEGDGPDATCNLVVVGSDGRSARVVYRGAPGRGLLGGVSEGGRRLQVAGLSGNYTLDAEGGMVGWSRLPADLSLEDLEADLAVGRSADSTRLSVHRGRELRHEFQLSAPALAARLSPDGETLGILFPDRIRLVTLDQSRPPLERLLDHPVQPDLVVSDSGDHAVVCRLDGRGLGVASPQGMTWYEVGLPARPLESGTAELDPYSGRFAVTDGSRILVGRAGVEGLVEVARTDDPTEALHLGEWTRDRGLLLTVQRGSLSRDGIYFLDPDSGRLQPFRLDSACLGDLASEAACTSR